MWLLLDNSLAIICSICMREHGQQRGVGAAARRVHHSSYCGGGARRSVCSCPTSSWGPPQVCHRAQGLRCHQCQQDATGSLNSPIP